MFLILFYTSSLQAFTKPQPVLDPVLQSDISVTTDHQALPITNETATITADQVIESAQAIIEKAQSKEQIESITLTYSDDMFATAAVDQNKDKDFVNDLLVYTHAQAPVTEEITTPVKKQKEKFLFFFPRPRFLNGKVSDIREWYGKKDKNYSDPTHKRYKIRQEWETLIGVDIFHPYYKYKEARRAMKEKVCFDTSKILPGVPKMKVTPEYKSKKIFITFSRKF